MLRGWLAGARLWFMGARRGWFMGASQVLPHLRFLFLAQHPRQPRQALATHPWAARAAQGCVASDSRGCRGWVSHGALSPLCIG